MKLEYRVLEVAEGYKQDCDYCLLDFRDFRFKNSLDINVATHEIVAIKENGEYDDIAYICGSCKKDLENDVLPYCEKCGRLKRSRKNCFCNLLEDKSIKPLSTEQILSRTFSARLESKTKELEKELSVTKEELKIEREEVTKFQEKSEEWGKRQKQELLDRIKELEEEVEQLKEQNKQVAQVEVKSNKKSFLLFGKKS